MLKLIAVLIITTTCYGARTGPSVAATKGEVWPKPRQQEKSEDYFILRPHIFNFKAPTDIGCPNFLNDALVRYWTIITKRETKLQRSLEQADTNFVGYLDVLEIKLEGECLDENIIPELGDVENYTITVNSSETTLSAPSIWGVLRGLETFSQLIYFEEDVLKINVTTITDYPRFPHRGLLIDTSRHYQPVDIILKMLDAMSYNKFNVFHWHITDDHSFPYQSRTFPELSDRGAYHPVTKIYNQEDIKRIIEYARLRGIRIIPEFDTPGHTSSWGEAHPELLTTCYSQDVPTGDLGPMDPTKENTYDFITKLFTEVVEVFPDSYFHIGGDEVNFRCWESNPEISTFVATNNITDYTQLESYFVQKVVNLLDSLNSKYLVWEEVFVNGADLPNSTIVHVWGNNGLSTLSQVTNAGKFALYSSCWYLSVLNGGGDWHNFYECEPLQFFGSADQNKLVLGGEACMWGEYVNEYSIIPRVWPRASAVAERLWSDATLRFWIEAQGRLEEHACRMNYRGIEAQPPNGPGFCP